MGNRAVREARRSNLTNCPHKRAYHSWAEAKRAAKRLRWNTGDATHPYVCKSCGKIHLGGS